MNNYTQIFRNHSMGCGRMIGYSKSMYMRDHPDNIVYFNANVFTEEDGKIWWGDIDFTLDEENLQKVAEEIGKKLYILREHDGRFENELLDVEKMKEKAQKIVG